MLLSNPLNQKSIWKTILCKFSIKIMSNIILCRLWYFLYSFHLIKNTLFLFLYYIRIFSTNHESQRYEDHYPPITHHSASFAGNTPSFSRQHLSVANQNPVARQYPPVTRHSASFARNAPSFTRQYPPVANQYPVAPQYPLVVTTQYPLVATQYPQIAQQYPPVALGFSGVSTSGLFEPHHPRFAPTNSPFNNVSSSTGP